MAEMKLVAAVLLLAAAEPLGAAHPVDRWKAFVAEASERFAIPRAWIRGVITAESGGEALLGGLPVTSRAGAMGLMQLMPETWDEMRRKHDLGFDPYDPRDNILAGTAYLRLMYDRFGYPGLFGAYNAGPQRFASYLAGRARLPTETLDYVTKVDRFAFRRPKSGRGLSPRFASVALFALDDRMTSTSADIGPGALAHGLFAILKDRSGKVQILGNDVEAGLIERHTAPFGSRMDAKRSRVRLIAEIRPFHKRM